jgi:hypothetical protein
VFGQVWSDPVEWLPAWLFRVWSKKSGVLDKTEMSKAPIPCLDMPPWNTFLFLPDFFDQRWKASNGAVLQGDQGSDQSPDFADH